MTRTKKKKKIIKKKILKKVTNPKKKVKKKTSKIKTKIIKTRKKIPTKLNKKIAKNIAKEKIGKIAKEPSSANPVVVDYSVFNDMEKQRQDQEISEKKQELKQKIIKIRDENTSSNEILHSSEKIPVYNADKHPLSRDFSQEPSSELDQEQEKKEEEERERQEKKKDEETDSNKIK